MRLDSPEFVIKNDPKGMMEKTKGFPAQCREALSISKAFSFSSSLSGKSNVVVLGMGGSAAGGDFLACLLHEFSTVPCFVVRDYVLPAFVGPSSLVFACSYSGNTEETLSAVAEALKRGCSVVGVTSGGALSEMGFPCVLIPAGYPPRTALGFMFLPLVAACEELGYIPEVKWDAALYELECCANDWGMDSPFETNPAKALASKLFGRIPMIYGLGIWQSAVANRWRGQLNENAKIIAHSAALPEMNHNEIIGWEMADRQNAKHWATVFLVSGLESERMKLRAAVTSDLIRDKSEVFHVTARGESRVAQILSLAYCGDFVSLYLAAMNGVDPESIAGINTLKSALAEL